MRIVNLKEFVKLPSGTIFMKYRPCVFEYLCAKEDTLEKTNDFFFSNIRVNPRPVGRGAVTF